MVKIINRKKQIKGKIQGLPEDYKASATQVRSEVRLTSAMACPQNYKHIKQY